MAGLPQQRHSSSVIIQELKEYIHSEVQGALTHLSNLIQDLFQEQNIDLREAIISLVKEPENLWRANKAMITKGVLNMFFNQQAANN
jgi:hypothetical protein